MNARNALTGHVEEGPSINAFKAGLDKQCQGQQYCVAPVHDDYNPNKSDATGLDRIQASKPDEIRRITHFAVIALSKNYNNRVSPIPRESLGCFV